MPYFHTNLQGQPLKNSNIRPLPLALFGLHDVDSLHPLTYNGEIIHRVWHDQDL